MEKEIHNKLKQEQRSITLHRLISNRNLVIGSILSTIMILTALLAPLLASNDPYSMEVMARLSPVSAEHLMGTDDFGRDLFARIVYGARVSVSVGFVVTLIASFLGLIIGLYASYYRRLEPLLMRICDGINAIPGILLAIALMSALGASVANVIIALTIVFTPGIARVVRASAIVIKEQPYIEAVRIQGAGHVRILWLNIAPNVISPLLVQAAFVFASAILSEASLSFLGAGIPEPQPSWGNILQASKLVIGKAWWMAVFPGTMLVLSVLGLNLLGDGLRDFFDPRTAAAKRKIKIKNSEAD